MAPTTHLSIYATALCVGASLLVLHGCMQYVPPPLDSERVRQSDVVRDGNDLSDLQIDALDGLLATSVGDLNERPIYVWFGYTGAEVTDVYVVGHADGPCCSLVSSALAKTVLEQPELSEWETYGAGALHANAGAKQHTDTLAKLRDVLRTYHSDRRCIGQLVLADMDGDLIAQNNETLHQTAYQAMDESRRHGRPIAIRHERRTVPYIVPSLLVEETAATGPRRLNPVTFAVPTEALSLPAEVVGSVSNDGLGQHREELEHAIELLTKLIELPREKLEHVLAVDEYRWKIVSTNAGAIKQEDEAKIRAASQAVRSALNEQQDLSSLLQIFITYDSSIDRNVALAALAEIRDTKTKFRGLLEQNRATLQTVHDGDPDKPVTFNLEMTSDISNRSRRRSAKVLESIDPISLRSQREELESELADVLTYERYRPLDPAAMLTDAALRGWPASFSERRYQNEFDRWVSANQLSLLEDAKRELSRRYRGRQLDTLFDTFFSSEVFFDVDRRAQELEIRPQSVLAGPFYLIADAATGTVRFEYVLADQHLLRLNAES